MILFYINGEEQSLATKLAIVLGNNLTQYLFIGDKF